MSDIMIAIVHGVGATRPSNTLTAITAELEKRDFKFAAYTEQHPHDDPDLPATHIRRGKFGQRRVLAAEAYWGDVTKVHRGYIHTLWSTFTNLFGMYALADAAAADGTRLTSAIRNLWRYFLAIFAFASVPLNLFALVLGLVALHFSDTIPGWTDASSNLLLTSFFCLASVFVVWRVSRKRTYQDRPFLKTVLTGFVTLCLVCIAIGIFDKASDGNREATQFIKNHFVAGYGRFIASNAHANIQKLPDINLCAQSQEPLDDNCIAATAVFIAALQIAQNIALFVMVLIAFFAFVLTAVALLVRLFNRAPVSPIVMASNAVFTAWFMWGLLLIVAAPSDIISSITFANFSEFSHHGFYDAYLHELVPVIFIGGVVLLGAVVFLLRWIGKARAKAAWRPDRSTLDLDAWAPQIATNSQGEERIKAPKRQVRPRLLFSWLTQSFTFLFSLAVVLFFSYVLAVWSAEWLSGHHGDSLKYVPDFLRTDSKTPVNFSHLFLGVILILFLMGVFGYAMRFGLEASNDIVNHFTGRSGQFPVRQRIADIFRFTLDKLFAETKKGGAAVKPIDLYIFAHSQGTVITLDHFLKTEFWEDHLKIRVRSCTILTFGSPITHLYQKYFSSIYGPDAITASGQVLQARLHTLSKDERLKWYNIYRVDDYIGTYILGPNLQFPTNIPCAPNGHMRYWEEDIFDALDPILPQRSTPED